MVTDIWAEFLNIIRQEVGSRIVETWFKAVCLMRWDAHESIVYLQAPNRFVRDWIKSHYMHLIESQLARLLNVEKVSVIFLDLMQERVDVLISNSAEKNATNGHEVTVIPAKKVLSEANKQRGVINRQHLFETFVVGPNNSLAYAAAQAVADKPGMVYNPLFLYGGSGLGKTHLLHAIGNAAKTRDKRLTIVYQSADRFVHEFISAIRFDEVTKFQAKYKSTDILLIDDIQFISNKDQTQEAFFHIFNTLYESHKQIIFSSDTFPQNMKGIAERLKSRLSCGLVADLRAPTLETKIAIIKKKADMSNEIISDEVAHYIASSVVSNIRELEGALIRVVACAALTQQQITIELAQQVLKTSHASNTNRCVDEGIVFCAIEKKYACTVDQLQSKSRNKELSFARQITMFLLKKMTDKSLRDIGTLLGGRDHSTVLHAINRIEIQLQADSALQEEVQYIEDEVIRQCQQ